MAKKDTPIHKHAGGRPTKYSIELGDRICEEIMKSEKGIFALSEQLDWFPAPSSIYLWLTLHPEFSEYYTRCRQAQQDRMAENIIKIADDSSEDEIVTEKGVRFENREFTSRSKLRVETRMWLMERLAPKKYGKQIEDTETKKYEPPQINVHISPEAIAKAKEAQE
jgi:hypothetical protein